MAAPLSTALRSINRDKCSRLNILAINSHEGLQHVLVKTEHQFTFVNHKGIRPWNISLRDIPSNCCVMQGENIVEQLKTDMAFDLILCSSRHDQYPLLIQVAQQMSCPIINMQYDLSAPDANVFHIRSLADQLYNMTVFDSEFTANSWGFDVDDPSICVIPRGIDTDFFSGWTGGDKRVLTVANFFPQNSIMTGFDLWQKVTDGLTVNKVGFSPGFSQPVNGLDSLVDTYRKTAVFLNTSSWKSCPMSLLEAMSVGCPIVTTATTTIPEFIKNGVNGFITNDPVIMRQRLEELIDDQEMALEIGAAGRKTVLEQFSQQQFLDKWNEVFWKVAQSPTGQWT